VSLFPQAGLRQSDRQAARAGVLSTGQEASNSDRNLFSSFNGYASIYKKSPVGNSYVGGIDPKTGNFMQSVAWETVQEYFGKSQRVSDSR